MSHLLRNAIVDAIEEQNFLLTRQWIRSTHPPQA